MSLDGLRAWIGVVERKLTMRTRVFLVLVAIAIGGAGAGIYLALEANDNAVSETELQAVRDELAESVAQAAGGDTAQLEAELQALKTEVETLRQEQTAGKQGTGTSSGPAGNAPDDSRTGTPGGASGGAKDQQQTRLKELLEQSAEEPKRK